MARPIFSIAVLTLCACEAPAPDTSASDSAARQLAIVESHGGSPAEICDAARKLQAAYLAEENVENYDFTKMRADIACLHAESLR